MIPRHTSFVLPDGFSKQVVLTGFHLKSTLKITSTYLAPDIQMSKVADFFSNAFYSKPQCCGFSSIFPVISLL